MKNENPRMFYILLVGLVVFSGFIYFKLEDFLDLANNLINFKDSHPSEMISFDKFLSSLDSGEIKKVDLYENAEIVVFDSFNSLNDKLQHVGVKIPIRNSSLILKLREYNIDFTAHPSVTFDSVWSILSALLIPVLLIVVYQLFFSEGSNYDFFEVYAKHVQKFN